MDPQAPRKRAFESKTPPSFPPIHPPPSPYLQPYSSVPFTPSHIPRSQSAEFVQLPRPTRTAPGGYQSAVTPPSPLRDSLTAESSALAPTLLTSGYSLGHSSAASIRSCGISRALNAFPIESDWHQIGSPVSDRVTRQTQQTFHLGAVEYPLEHPGANHGGAGPFRRGALEYSNARLPDSERRGFVNNLLNRHSVLGVDDTCSGCSQCGGEFDFASAFSLDSVAKGAHLEGEIGLAISAPPVPSPFQEVERPKSTSTPSSVLFFSSEFAAPTVAGNYRLPRSRPLGPAGFFSRFPAAKIMNLNESDAFSTVHHTTRYCEGCILCTPRPSPRISPVGSASHSGGNFLAHSDQLAGPPPTDSLSTLGDQELTAPRDIPSSPTVVGSPDISMSSIERGVQAPYRDYPSADLLRPDPEDRIPRRPLRRRRSGYFLPVAGGAGGVFLQSESFCDDINGPSYNEADPCNKLADEPQPESSGDKGSLHSNGTISDISQVLLSPRQQPTQVTFIDPSSSHEQIRINTRGLDKHEPHKKSLNLTPLSTLTSSNGMGESGNRSFWTSSVFNNRDHPSPTGWGGAGSWFGRASRPPTVQGVRRAGIALQAGERRDRRFSGANGSYELADLGTANVSTVTIEANNIKRRSSLVTLFGSVMDPKKWKPSNDLHLTTKQKWWYSALGVVLLAIVTLSIFTFAGGPVLFRRAMEDTKFDIQSLKLDNFTPESLSVRMKIRVQMQDGSNLALGPTFYHLGTNNSLTPGHIHSSVESMLPVLPGAPVFDPEATIFRKRFIGEMAPHSLGNQTKVGDLGAMYRPGILGTFKAEGTTITSGKAALEFGEGVRLGVDGDLRLEDPRAWAGLLTALLYREHLELRVSGTVLAKFLWVWRRSDVSKRLSINGMNSFKGFQIQNHEAFSSPSGQFSAELTWYNPSHVSLALPRIDFDLLAGGHKIGNSTISNMRITPGDNTITGFTGSLDPKIFRSNRTLLSRYLSGFIAQANGEEFSLLQLQGIAAITNNKKVYWLSPAIERMTFDLPLTARDPSHPGLTDPLGESFEWDFVFAAGMSMLELTNGTLSMTLTLPFESAMFPVHIEDVRWDLTISNHQGPFLRIVSKFGSSSNEIVPLGVNSHSIRSRLDKHTLVDVLEREIWNMYFTRDFVGSTAVHLTIAGTVTLEVVTPLGNATVSGLGVRNEQWDMKGLGGLDSHGEFPAEILHPIAFEDKKWMVGFRMHNPSAIEIALGASTFAMYMGSGLGCFGVLKVNDLNLTRGWSNLIGVVEADEERCVGSDLGKFLSMVVAGGIYRLTTKFVDCHIKYVLFDSLDIWIQQDGPKVVITIADEISPAMSFTLVDIAMLGLTKWMGVNSTIEPTSSRSTSQLPQLDLTSNSSAASTASDLNQFIGRDMRLGVEGKLGINWNGVQTLIDYAQQDIPVRVRRIMA